MNRGYNRGHNNHRSPAQDAACVPAGERRAGETCRWVQRCVRNAHSSMGGAGYPQSVIHERQLLTESYPQERLCALGITFGEKKISILVMLQLRIFQQNAYDAPLLYFQGDLIIESPMRARASERGMALCAPLGENLSYPQAKVSTGVIPQKLFTDKSYQQQVIHTQELSTAVIPPKQVIHRSLL